MFTETGRGKADKNLHIQSTLGSQIALSKRPHAYGVQGRNLEVWRELTDAEQRVPVMILSNKSYV